MHQAHRRKLGSTLHVYRTPDAARFPRRKPNLVAGLVDTLANAIDPAKAQRAIHRFWPSDAWAAGIALVEANPEFCSVGMIFLEPRAPRGGRREEKRLHRHTLRIISKQNYISQR